MALLAKSSLHTRHTLKINVVRFRVHNGELELSLALPCTHCRTLLTKTAVYRYRQYGQTIKLRYSLNDQTLSPFLKISDLPPSLLSSGYRMLYRKY